MSLCVEGVTSAGVGSGGHKERPVAPLNGDDALRAGGLEVRG